MRAVLYYSYIFFVRENWISEIELMSLKAIFISQIETGLLAEESCQEVRGGELEAINSHGGEAAGILNGGQLRSQCGHIECQVEVQGASGESSSANKGNFQIQNNEIKKKIKCEMTKT